MNPLEFVLLLLLGMFAGTYGTIVGAGGGFVIVPSLSLIPLYLSMTPQSITGISLVAVIANAISAVIAYSRQHRILYSIAFFLGACAIPGAILGRNAVAYFDRSRFEMLFGAVLVLLAIYLMLRKPPKRRSPGEVHHRFGVIHRTFQVDGKEEVAEIDLRIGAVAVFVIGFLAALFGLGGGLMLVPILVAVLAIPPSYATATSQMYLLLATLVAIITDLFTGGKALTEHWEMALPLAIGTVLGAQAGARVSKYLTDKWIVRLLAIALGFAGLRLVYSGLTR